LEEPFDSYTWNLSESQKSNYKVLSTARSTQTNERPNNFKNSGEDNNDSENPRRNNNRSNSDDDDPRDNDLDRSIGCKKHF
jgi:hypothetical protein